MNFSHPSLAQLVSRAASVARDATPLRVVTWNLEDFSAENADKLKRLSHAIVDNLKCPHILAVQEMCGPTATADNPNPTNPNAEALIAAIEARSGYHYAYCEVPPASGKNGGPPGSNIRCGFFYRTDRVVLTPPELGETPRTRQGFAITEKGPRLHLTNPQVHAANSWAFHNIRKPLVAQFTDLTSDEQYSIINVHLKSNPALYKDSGRIVPSVNEIRARNRRRSQAYVIRDLTRDLWGIHNNVSDQATSHVMLCGDFNATVKEPPAQTYPYRQYGSKNGRDTLSILEHPGFLRISDDLPTGTSHRIGDFTSDIDHVFVSWTLAQRARVSRFILNNGDEKNRLSDHNPTITSIAPLRQQQASAGRGIA